MKKYHQLLLLIISIISLSLFLIYRHEYNRLHYVLEVFSFFGQPCNISSLHQSEDVIKQHDWGPLPVWQDQTGGYIYSGFLTRKLEAQALVIIDDEKLPFQNCYLWFEDKHKPIIGKFTFSRARVADEGTSSLYSYKCTMRNGEEAPYAVSFSKFSTESDLRKIMLTHVFEETYVVNTTICVPPGVYSKRGLVEFISFHHLIGVDAFIFYNRDIPPRLVKLLLNLSKTLELNLTFLPWNYPKSDSSIARTIVETDCLLRTSKKSLYAAVLELDEFIVPFQASNINALMQVIHTDSERVRLPFQRFCVKNSEATKPIVVLNTDVLADGPPLSRFIYRNQHQSNVVSTQVVNGGFASVHKYTPCTDGSAKMFTDRSIMRFSTDLVRSTLFQFFLQGQI